MWLPKYQGHEAAQVTISSSCVGWEEKEPQTDAVGDLAGHPVKQSENFRHQQFGLNLLLCMWVLLTQACTTDATKRPQTRLRDNLQAAPAFLHILWV